MQPQALSLLGSLAKHITKNIENYKESLGLKYKPNKVLITPNKILNLYNSTITDLFKNKQIKISLILGPRCKLLGGKSSFPPLEKDLSLDKGVKVHILRC